MKDSDLPPRRNNVRARVRERSSAFLCVPRAADGSGNGASARHYWQTRTPSDVGRTLSASVWTQK